MGRVVIPGFRKIETSGGGEGGTSNYNDLTNKPSINNIPLVGNLSTADLKLTDATLTEEGVPAEAKTVGTKLEEQSTSLTALSEQLGNHTVKSDVPENAVFTDTIYDDTEVRGSIEELNNTTMCSYAGNGATVSTNDWEYHGTNITIPKGYYALVVAERKWSSGKPSGVAISLSDTENTEHSMCTQTEGVQSAFSTSFIVTANDNPVTVYLWGKGEVGKSGEVMFAILHKIT